MTHTCGCEACRPGDPLETYTKSHMEACEVRFVLKMRPAQLAAYYADVARKRGDVAMSKLKQRVDDEWYRRKTRAAA